MNIKKRQEVINLMPWYNLGKLTDAEKSLVDEALASDPTLREQLALDKDIMTKVLAEPELLDRSAFESSTIRLNNVLAQIDDTVVQKIPSMKEAPSSNETKQSPDLFSGIKSFFVDLLSGSSHSFTYAVFAALAVVQLSLVVFFTDKPTMQSSYTASDGESTIINGSSDPTASAEPTSSLVLVVAMEDNIQIEGFTSKKLGDIKFDLLPDSYGYYRIRLNKKLTPDEIEVLRDELSHRTNKVIFVSQEIPPK